LRKQLNEIDPSFGLPEGEYSFEYERRIYEIMEEEWDKLSPQEREDIARKERIGDGDEIYDENRSNESVV
jgi:hypothetical protein